MYLSIISIFFSCFRLAFVVAKLKDTNNLKNVVILMMQINIIGMDLVTHIVFIRMKNKFITVLNCHIIIHTNF